MDGRMTIKLVSESLHRAVESKRHVKGLSHHSGRGSQYCSYDFRDLLDKFGMKASMSRKGNCYDNADQGCKSGQESEGASGSDPLGGCQGHLPSGGRASTDCETAVRHRVIDLKQYGPAMRHLIDSCI